jgi:CBS domain-containing protein
MPDSGMVYYYSLLIFCLISVGVIVWLAVYIRELKQQDASGPARPAVDIGGRLTSRLDVRGPVRGGAPSGGDGSGGAAEFHLDEAAKGLLGEPGRLELREFFKNTKIKTVMPKRVISIREDAEFKQVPRLFNENHIRHLPVVDGGNRLVGLITEKDMYRICPPRKLLDGTWHYDDDMLEGFILKYVMIKDPICLTGEDCIGEALAGMVYARLGCVPVVRGRDDKYLTGIITRRDIMLLGANIYLSSK